MTYCSICKLVICASQRSAKFYQPIRPEHFTRAHVGCIRQLDEDATHENLVLVVVGGRPSGSLPHLER
jgi:hypothetical protein